MKNINEEKHTLLFKLFKLWVLNPDSQIACVSKGKHDMTILKQAECYENINDNDLGHVPNKPERMIPFDGLFHT